jgi:hypothetical protein
MATKSVVFTPALGQVVTVPADVSSFAIYASSPDPVELTAHPGNNQDVPFTEINVASVGSERLWTYRATFSVTDVKGEISVTGSDGTELGMVGLVQSHEKGADREFVTEIVLEENEEFKSQRLDWLDSKDWEGWAWYRPRETWIEASFTHLTRLNPQTPTHNLLLHPTNPGIDPRSVLAVFPASTREAFVTLSAARNGDLPGVYARVRRVKSGGRIKVCVTGKLSVNKGTTSAIFDAVEVARARYGLPTGTPFIEEAGETPFDRLGFCTWSSIGENVPLSYDLMENLVQLLNRDKVPVGTFLIDDGWQDIRYGHNGAEMTRGLWDFGTWDRMKSSLADNIALIKKNLPTVKDFGVWMTLSGYWNSISPYSPLARKYEMRMYPLERNNVRGIAWHNNGFDGQQSGSIADPEVRTHCLPPPHRAYDFWQGYFQSQAEAGISFVKVDNQAYQSFLQGVEGGAEFVAMWDNMIQAANDIFGENRVIHCMAHYERMFNGDIGMGAATKGKKIVIRNTDDFGLQRRNIHRDHIQHNLYNGMLLSHQCFYLDTDMFMTSDQWPEYHAVLRAFFNGPIFLADKPGVGDFKVHAKLTGRTPGDETSYRVIRAPNVVRPLRRTVWEKTLDEGRGASIKAASYFPKSQSAAIVMWNARCDAVDHSVDVLFAGDVLDALDDGKTASGDAWDGVLWAENARKATTVSTSSKSASDLEIIASEPVLTTSIAPESYEVLTVAPFHTVGQVKVAVLGLIDKYAGLAGIESSKTHDGSLVVETKFDGTLGFVVSGAPHVKATIDGSAAELSSESLDGGLMLVTVDLTSAPATAGQSSWTVAITI